MRRPILGGMANDHHTWVVDVGVGNADLLTRESRTALLAPEYRPVDLGGGRVRYGLRALGAARELGPEEDGYLTEDAEGLRVWIGEDAFELVLHEG